MRFLLLSILALSSVSIASADELGALLQAGPVASESLLKMRSAVAKDHQDALAVAYQRLFSLFDQRRENQHALEAQKLELSRRVKEFRLDVENYRHDGGKFKPNPDGIADDQLAKMILDHRRSLHESASGEELYVFIATFKQDITNYCPSEDGIYHAAVDIETINQKAVDIEAAVAETQEIIRTLSKS